MADDSKNQRNFLPSRFMRERRPYLFSDSRDVEEGQISREVLSHHLETITKQKGEVPFEQFARRLAQKFIAPNMRPQTGPTGGGDGKTDAESYPVDPEVSARWFNANPDDADSRMAFAFSAKEKWRPKVQDDVKEIAGTKRDYRRIYFITNQLVPAKDSAKLQDELETEHGIPVTILDRTWLLDRVFEDHSIDIAIDALGLGEGHARSIRVVGPRDLKRLQEIDEIEHRIGDATTYAGTPHQLIEDALRSAILSRGLEQPRHEVDGKFLRAIRLAKKHNLRRLELDAVYAQAWTANFWYDDFDELTRLYEEVERLGIDTETADVIELLTNLHSVMRTAVMHGQLLPEAAKLEVRSGRLVASLERLVADTYRPNNAHHAHSLLLMMRLAELGHEASADDTDALWKEFKTLIVEAEGLGSFPFESVANILTEFGDYITDSAAFDELYEVLTDALAKRRSEGEAATRNARRGLQKLEAGLAYDAIRWYGRAVGLLIKDEFQEDLEEALIACSYAYEQAGLLWAANLYATAAVNQEFARFTRTGSINEIHPGHVMRWMVLELRLGRVPFALSLHEMGMIVRTNRDKTEKQKENTAERLVDFNMWFGTLLMRTRFQDLPSLSRFPETLERLLLDQASMAPLYLMGRLDVLRQEAYLPPDETDEDADELFRQWYLSGEKLELPEHPDYLLGERAIFRSHVIGCDLEVDCANNLTSIAVAGAVLGAIEALLATSLSHPIFPVLDKLKLRIDPEDTTELAPKLVFAEEDGLPVGLITHRPMLTFNNRSEAGTFHEWLHGATLEIVFTFGIPRDIDKWSQTVLGEESAFDRALSFSLLPYAYSHIFGSKGRLSITDWEKPEDKAFDVTRAVAWSPPTPTKAASTATPRNFMGAQAPEGMFDPESGKHTNIRVVSPIDVVRWDKANWSGASFITSPGNPHFPPVLALMFTDREAAESIFRGLRARYGLDDRDNALRVAIIRGLHISNPNAYGLSIGPNHDLIDFKEGDQVGIMARHNVMRPTTSENLNTFLAAYAEHGRFLLAPAYFANMSAPPEPFYDLGIGKHHLDVTQAWMLGPGAPDSSILSPDDPPYVPADVANPPAIEAIKLLEAFRKKHPD